jgi:hypothetical protein
MTYTKRTPKIKKKAFFFTVIALVVIGFFFLTYSLYASYREVVRTSVIETRVFTMNNFVKNIDQDMARALYISGFRSLLTLTDNVVSTGIYVQDLNGEFDSVIYNGTINSTIQHLMVENTISYWIQKIQEESDKINLDTTIIISPVTITQTDPWTVKLSMDANVSITDQDGVASWNITRQVEAEVPIEGFEDPFYAVQTEGKLSRAIRRSNTTIWDVNSLKFHLENQTYLDSTEGPSFLLRLQGSTNSSPYGLETMVDTEDLYDYGFELENKSSVDYLYWGSGGVNHTYIHNITDRGYPYFRLDQTHRERFNVSWLAYT